MTTKREIRRQLLATRQALSAEEAGRQSAAVIQNLRALPAFRAARVFLCYVASKDNEVDTRPLIVSLLSEGKTVLVPIANKDRSMDWSRLLDLAELAPSRFGILEPRPEFIRLTSPLVESIVLVPGVAFTTTCFRIGYGGGYYDRFLAAYRGTKIGLAYDLQIISPFDIAPHDIRLDLVVTESTVYD